MDNVVELIPLEHWTFEVFQQRHGYRAEGYKNGSLMWEYESDSLGNIQAIVLRTIGRIK